MCSSAEAECFGKKNASETKNVRMAVEAGLQGVVCGTFVTVQCCGSAIKHGGFKGFKVDFLLSFQAIN